MQNACAATIQRVKHLVKIKEQSHLTRPQTCPKSSALAQDLGQVREKVEAKNGLDLTTQAGVVIYLREIMLQQFSIKNFKSLSLETPVTFHQGLNIIIGLNGSGKSTVLQAIDFVNHLPVENDGYGKWLQKREWEPEDLGCKIKKEGKVSSLIEFAIQYKDASLSWEGDLNWKRGICTREKLTYADGDDNRTFTLSSQKLSGYTKLPQLDVKNIRYSGSIFSVFPPDTQTSFLGILGKCHSLDLLNPVKMRTRTRALRFAGIGLGGEQLSQYLHTLPQEAKVRLEEILRRFYPTFSHYKTTKLRGGAKKLTLLESFRNAANLSIDALHACDGVLRVMAIVAESIACQDGSLLIDEIEDGINPELLEKLVAYLREEARCQTIVTTHNPFILSCLTDEEARRAVLLAYKDDEGISHVVPFFNLPTPAKMLENLYPGEVMLQVNLEDVAREAAAALKEQ